MAEQEKDVQESEETPAGSSPEQEKTPSVEPEEPGEETPKEPEEEAPKEPEFARDPDSRYNRRLRELINERKRLEVELEKAKTTRPSEPPRERTPQQPYRTPEYYRAPETPSPATQQRELEEAITRLKDLGFVTREESLSREELRKEIQKVEDKILLDAEYRRLEDLYTGKDGRPSFDRQVIQDYAVKEGIYNPEAAYEHLYRKELLDWSVKDALKKQKKEPYTEKPGASPGKARAEEGALTPEKIRKMSPQEYERRREEIQRWTKEYTEARAKDILEG